MDNRTLLKTGIAGSVIAAICCATPVLVIALGVVGLSAWTGWLDYVLIPALVVFVGITIYAWRRRRAEAACCEVEIGLNQKKGV
ncbi:MULTISPECIES: mercury resistance system transport protein MerF [Thauera]|uniref:mercury resistance system transport protein MerF n=1 Tax=Thauera TaxID=33057 RepID=UPI001884F8F5|nr:mercury resistance system transport protein MerF [Thauera sp. 2A1]KAI5915617.1 mercury resistance system transport protein MerF [Thauera sp. 2A1]MBS0542394.1 mercury resistance system transport protein MerF [Pseudomonadota bacterium]